MSIDPEFRIPISAVLIGVSGVLWLARPSQPRWASARSWFLVYLAFFLQTAAASLLGGVVSDLTTPKLEGDRLLAASVASFLGILIVLGVVALTRGMPTLRTLLGLEIPRRSQVVRYAAGYIALHVVVQLVTSCFALDEGSARSRLLLATSSNVWLLCAWMIVASSLSEEVIYRGLLLAPLARVAVPWSTTVLAAGLSSALWAESHLLPLGETIVFVAYGLALAAARLRSRSIVVSWVMHGTWNAVAIASIQADLSLKALGF